MDALTWIAVASIVMAGLTTGFGTMGPALAEGRAVSVALSALAQQPDGAGHALSDVKLEAPIADAQKYLAIGMNYQDHADEAARAGVPVPKNQLWFNKQVSCITGPYA
ncbi:MAG: hypothetical protein Q8M33_17645, partial [Hydrogenophaga sp.]|nr:hypothetical protein [Hydrogenophaga sp.]